MKRSRITITLQEHIVSDLDRLVDGERIRNRSHAVEYLLMQTMKPRIGTAFILAGGKGVRMKPFTHELPKSLLPVRGKPILEHQIDLLRNADIRNIVILIGHLGEKIKAHFGDGSKLGVSLSYLEQKEKEIGTAYALHYAEHALTGKPFLALYGDVLAQINLRDLISHHSAAGATATVALTSIKYPSFYGVAKLRGEKITQFLEKPREHEELSRVISAGIFCCEPSIFKTIGTKQTAALERDIFPKLATEGKLNGYLFEGKWFDIGTRDIYARAIKEWR